MAQENVDTKSLVIVRWLREYVAMLKMTRRVRYGDFPDVDSQIDKRVADVEAFLERLTKAQVVN